MPEDREYKPKPQLGKKGIIFICIFAIVAILGIALRLYDKSALASETEDQAIPTVAVIHPSKSAANEDIVLPGTVQAWHEAPIYARTSGYLKSWKSDIGTSVKEGDQIALIETPEIDAELRQAQADLKTAEANNQLAQSTAKRWQDLLKTDSVSKQEADEKSSDALAKSALVASARANVERLTNLESFKKVVAPFDGTITARNTDIGALINAGSGSGNGPELFHIADTSKLRIYVQVPETYASAITPDLTIELHFAEHPGKTYTAKFAKSANALDPSTRTLLVQFETDNAGGELLAGGYTEVHMKLDTHAETLRLPVNTLIFRGKDIQVAVTDVVTGNGTIKLVPISQGRDFGSEVEVASGINATDNIVVNPPDSIIDGQKVKVIKSSPKKDDAVAKKDDSAKKDDKKSEPVTEKK